MGASAFFTLVLALEIGCELYLPALQSSRLSGSKKVRIDMVLLTIEVVTASVALFTSVPSWCVALRLLRLFRIARCRLFHSIPSLARSRAVFDHVISAFMISGPMLTTLIFLWLVATAMTTLIMEDYLVDLERNPTNSTKTCQDKAAFQDRWGTPVACFVTVIMALSGGVDWVDAYDTFKCSGPIPAFIFIAWIVCFQFIIGNAIMTLFVDKVLRSRKAMEQEELELQRAQTESSKAFLLEVLAEEDLDRDDIADFAELETAFQSDKARQWLHGNGFDMHEFDFFFKVVAGFDIYEELTVEEFLDSCLRVRGPATNMDMQALKLQIQTLLNMATAGTNITKSHMVGR